MARLYEPLQMYRGEDAKAKVYTGPEGELTVNTTRKTVAVHDGVTAGGFPMAREDRKISVGSGLKINGNVAEATLADDIAITIDAAKTAEALIGASANGNELLKADSDGKLSVAIDMAYNTTTGKFDLLDSDGNVVATVTVPSSTSMLKESALVVDPAGQEAGTYLKLTLLLADGTTTDQFVNVTSLIDVYTGGDGIDITSNTVKLDLAASNNLAVIESGKLHVPSDLGVME